MGKIKINIKNMGLNFKALLMEFLGVFALCYIGGLSCVMPERGLAADYQLNTPDGTISGPLAHMLALMVMIYVGAATSGAHYNPAVSLAMLLTGNQTFIETLLYMAFQFAGGLAAGFMVWFICMHGTNDKHNVGYASTYPKVNTAKGDGVVLKAIFMEFFATFFLVWMVFGTAVDQVNVRKGGFGSVYGAAIGGTVAMSACGIGGWTGAALNPARWLGPWIVSLMACTEQEKADHSSMGVLAYTIGCFGGGAVGGLTYKLLFLPKD